MITFHRNAYALTGVGVVAIVLIAFLVFFKGSNREEAATSPVGSEVGTTDSASMTTEENIAPSEMVAIESTQEIEADTPTPIAIDAITPKTTTSKTQTDPGTSASVVTNPPNIPKESFSATTMLKEHNAVRSGVGIGGLTWSDTLSASAQKWSAQLKSEGCKMRHDLNTPYGENIYWAWNSDVRDGALISNPKQAVGFWAAEVEFYNYKKNTCVSGEQCGHYTQIVWERSTEVGCGVSTCIDDDAQTDIWVCRYNPPGNDGSHPY